jgi:gliding motility-associated-like protein
MRKLLFIGLVFLSLNVVSQITVTFNCTGGGQSFTVPPCVTSISVTARGAQGGGSGGLGAVVTGTINVTPGQTLAVNVGCQGGCPSAGYNGGGAGQNASGAGNASCGGGGASSVGGVIIAAGGGGMGGGDQNSSGGNGGCNSGIQGGSSFGGGGLGGTQTAGGTGGPGWGSGTPGSPGGFGVGGLGGPDNCCNLGPGGGGGGGYYGGGGGGGDCFCSAPLGGGGGGGGSSLVPAGGGCSAGANSGAGSVTITYTSTVPTVNPITNIVVCHGATIPASNFTSTPAGATFNWTNNNTTIGLGASGAGNTPAFTTTNTTTNPITATISVTATSGGCTGPATTYTITVNPAPTVNPIANIVVCHGASVPASSFASTPAGATFNWTNNNTAIGLATSGSGNTPAFTATNTTTNPITATISVTATSGGCTGPATTYTITVNPTPIVNAITNIVVCNGAAVPTSSFTSTPAGGTFTWINSNTAIGLAASGSGNTPAFTATNLTANPITATITVTPTVNGCVGTPTTYTITVNPGPIVNTIANIVVCNAATVPTSNFTSTPAGSTFNWTNNNTAIGLAASGSGNTPAFTATNTTTNPITATISVTPTSGGCTGPATTYTITVNPTPTVVVPANITLCAAATVPATNFTSTPAGATYTWTNSNTAIGLGASGAGNIAAFTATNSTTAPITATITVTPTVNGCVGTPSSYTITVNPSPTVNPIANIIVCNGNNIPVSNYTSPTAGVTFNWTNSNTAIGLGASGTGNIAAFTATNTTTAPITATISVTVFINGCPGAVTTYTITVNPSPTVVVPANITLCAGATVPATNFTSSVAGSTFAWTNSNTAIGLAANGTGNIATFTGTNTTANPITATISVTATANGCTGPASTYTITVNPNPVFTLSFTDPTTCGGTDGTITLSGLNPGANYTVSYNGGGAVTMTANASGNIIITGLAAGSYTNFVVTLNGCTTTDNSTITLTDPNPPTVNAGVDQTVCEGTAVTLTASNPNGATITWDNGVTDGVPFTPVVGTISYTVTANLAGCIATDQVNVTVNPNPTVTVPANITLCAGATVPATNFTSSVAGSTFAWTNSNTAIGLAANGTGNIATFTGTNTTANPITATISVTATVNGCTGLPSTYTITVNPNPVFTLSSTNPTTCGGTDGTITLSGLNPGANYTVSYNGGGAVTMTANASGNIIITGLGAGSYTNFVVTLNGCATTDNSTITLTDPNPPTVNAGADQTVCEGTAVILTASNPNGATITWDNGVTDGVPFTPVVGTISYTVTANLAGCITTDQVNVTVNPTPMVMVPANISLCAAATVTATNFTSPVTGATYTWTNSNTAIGLGASGTGNIAAFTATNTTANPITATITVTPTANGCVGTPSSYTITVAPSPTVDPIANITVCNGDNVAASNYTSPTAGVTFNWTNDNTAIGLGASGTGNTTAFTATNTTTNPIVANISVTAFINGCPGAPTTYTITVNPTPTVTVPANSTLCHGATVPSTNFTSPVAGTTYAWTNDNTGIGLGANGTGNIVSFTATNTTTAPITANITVTPTANGCVGTPSSYTITVDPSPTAEFTFTNVCFGTTTSFTNQSNPNSGTITNWNWDFTNNGIVNSTAQNPTNGYPAAGNYTVELMVQTALGCKDSTTKVVTVNPIPVANFTAPSVCLTESTFFNDISTITTGNIVNWQWDFGDGDTSTLQHPTHLYATANTFNVSLTVSTDSGCINTIVIPITVNAKPTAAFTTTDVCQNLAAQFTDQSLGNGDTINQWNWDIDFNGATHTTDYTTQNPSHNYTTANTYNVQLIITTVGGCSDTVINPITIHPMPVAGFNFTNQCDGNAVPFTDNSSVTSGNIATWNWNFGNNNTSANQNPTELYAGEGVYNVQLIATTNNGCSDTIAQQVSVYPNPVVNFSPVDVCLNTATQFTDLTTVSNLFTSNSLAQWNWDFGDGVGTSSQQHPVYTYAQSGTFQATLTVTTNNGCSSNIIVPVTVYPVPDVSFSADLLAGCSPIVVNFTDNTSIAVPGVNTIWHWNFGNGVTSSQQHPSGITFENLSNSSLASYGVSLTVTSDQGCVDKDSVTAMINVYPNPIASFTFSPDEADLFDSEITFTDLSVVAAQWYWDFGDGTTDVIQHPVHQYLDSGSYTVVLHIENQYGCKDSTEKVVIIKPTFAVYIPNAFTPDGDNINDFFFASGYGITQLETLIFDRWGEIIFEGYQLDSKWDGTYKNLLVETEVFNYKIRAKDIFGKWHEFIGKVTLIK